MHLSATKLLKLMAKDLRPWGIPEDLRTSSVSLVGDATATLDFPLAGAPGESPAVGKPITDQQKPSAAAAFARDQEVGAVLGKLEEKGGGHAGHRPAPAHPQVLLHLAGGALPGFRNWHRWRRWSALMPRPATGNRCSPGR